MPGLHSQRIGNKLIVQALENGVAVILFLVLHQADAVIGVKFSRIELIEGQPVIHQISQLFKQRIPSSLGLSSSPFG